MDYIIPSAPATLMSLPRLRSRARRVGYRIARDRYAHTFSLVDTRLHRPLLELDHVGLPEIADAVKSARTPHV